MSDLRKCPVCQQVRMRAHLTGDSPLSWWEDDCPCGFYFTPTWGCEFETVVEQDRSEVAYWNELESPAVV